jgi:hypothetical protein
MTHETSAFEPNVRQILSETIRIIKGKIPSKVRAELRAAVKAGVLGHLERDGLKPEVFYHTDHKNHAVERQQQDAIDALERIDKALRLPKIADTID